jgi:hypothetical protein
MKRYSTYYKTLIGTLVVSFILDSMVFYYQASIILSAILLVVCLIVSFLMGLTPDKDKYKTPRSIKSLLIILLSESSNIKSGLCHLVDTLYDNGKISREETNELLRFISGNKPLNARAYYWKEGLIEPRVQWLEEQIKKLE